LRYTLISIAYLSVLRHSKLFLPCKSKQLRRKISANKTNKFHQSRFCRFWCRPDRGRIFWHPL